jgi:hypothetical protein
VAIGCFNYQEVHNVTLGRESHLLHRMSGKQDGKSTVLGYMAVMTELVAAGVSSEVHLAQRSDYQHW